MAFTEFYCQTTGSNLNAGSTTTDAATFTYTSGNWVAETGVFTVDTGDPASDGVAVGDFASIYTAGATVAVFIARVTARDSTTITVSLTAKSGTAPTTSLAGDMVCKVGGAWKGPNGAVGFPFGFAAAAMVNVAGDQLRVNLKSGSNYAITAAVTHNLAGPSNFQGYTSSPGDGGKATIDGGTSGASYVLLTLGASGDHVNLVDLILGNNGATGSATGLTVGAGRLELRRVVVHDVRGHGISNGNIHSETIECEAYGCNQSNTANLGGIFAYNADRCISHDNAGANSSGFIASNSNSGYNWNNCIADSNGGDGFRSSGAGSMIKMIGCDAYNNSGDGLDIAGSSGNTLVVVENCNFVKNGGYGANKSGAGTVCGHMANCGFGAGTQANTSGTTNAVGALAESGTVTYAADVTPWVDPANGDFRINLAAAKNAGRGAFTQTASSYAGTVGYPDIGAAQHLDAGGGGNAVVAKNVLM